MAVDLDITLISAAGGTPIYMGPWARFQPAVNSGYSAVLGADNVVNEISRLYEILANGHTIIGSTTPTHSLPDKITVEVDGSDIRSLINDVQEVAPVTDATHPTGTRAGLDYFVSVTGLENIRGDNWQAADLDAPPAGGAGRHLPPGWGGPAAPPFGTGGPGGAPSGAPPGTAPGYGLTHPETRARQIADAICQDRTVEPSRHQSLELSLVQILHCLQGRSPPPAPQSAERSLNLIFAELGVARPYRVTLAQELDIIAAHLP